MAYPEKAIIDLLYLYPQYNTAEALLELRFDEWWMQEELDRERLLAYALQNRKTSSTCSSTLHVAHRYCIFDNL